MRPIPTDEIEIDGIEYDLNSSILRPISKEILDELYDFLVLNANLIVEINSHTDFRGTEKYNQWLSERRAQSCVTYLISRGISPGRLKAIGYGEAQPNYLKDANKKPVLKEGKRVILSEPFITAQESEELIDEYHQRNRRTSFKVVGESFNLESK